MPLTLKVAIFTRSDIHRRPAKWQAREQWRRAALPFCSDGLAGCGTIARADRRSIMDAAIVQMGLVEDDTIQLSYPLAWAIAEITDADLIGSLQGI